MRPPPRVFRCALAFAVAALFALGMLDAGVTRVRLYRC